MMAPLVLDISRTVSRIGAGGDSGVDRVERAYIREVTGWDRPVYFLTRVLGGAALLDREGMAALLALTSDPATLPGPDALGHLARRQTPARRRAETAVRQHALGWARNAKLPGFLKARIGGGFTYLNVGHSNLAAERLAALRAAGCERIVAMIHDVIPLDYPEYARPGTPEAFETLLRGLGRAADLLIYNSADTAARAQRWFEVWDLHPPGVTALLGVDPVDAMPPAKPGETPYFVMLGTIEPRKNHLLILNVWRRLWEEHQDPPHLHIVGRRGWENENILDILDRAPFMNACVFERGFLSDRELADLMSGARALLFPSFAEGFGYPLAEACQFGIPAICADLDVFREVASSGATYLDPLDGTGWLTEIQVLAAEPAHNTRNRTDVPNWETHFAVVNKAV